MPILERIDRLPMSVSSDVLSNINLAESPGDAASIVLQYDVNEAVSIIDNLDPLTAAFVVFQLQGVRRNNGSREMKKRKELADAILARGRELQIRGMNGLCYARDQVFRETGYFAGL